MAVHLASAEQPLVRAAASLSPARATRPAGGCSSRPGMSLFDAYGHADGALGLLLGRGVDADGWQYTMLAGPNPGPLPILTLARTPVLRRVRDRARLARRERADPPARRHRGQPARQVPHAATAGSRCC